MNPLIIDETGNQYGRLTVLRISSSSKHGVRWECVCSCCNKLITAYGYNLRRGNQTGCSRKNASRLTEFEDMYKSYMKRAKSKNLTWELNLKKFRELIKKNCHYCNAEPKQSYSGIANGLDRIDNSRGYTLNNIVPCCSECNYMKRNMSEKRFLEQVSNIYAFRHPSSGGAEYPMRVSRITSITGKEYGHVVKTGPQSCGYVKRLYNLPPEYLAALQGISASTGGTISVNELVRRAVRMYLTGGLLHPVYTGLVKT